MASSTPPTNSGDRRLNLLLSDDGWRSDSWSSQLPQLLGPMGVRSIRVECTREAEDVIRTMPVHIAVIDLAMPLDSRTADGVRRPGGVRVLQLLRRLSPAPPPTVVVRDGAPVERDRVRDLTAALRDGAFAVMAQPVRVEALLDILRRILQRHYSGLWPNS